MVLAWIALAVGVLAILLFAVGILGAYAQLLLPLTGFTIAMLLGLVVSIIGTILGAIAVARTASRARAAGRPPARAGLILSLVVLIPILVPFLSGLKYPAINDITTDFTNPPEFTHAEQLQERPGRDMNYDAAKYETKQKAGYPPLNPLHVDAPPETAFNRVKLTAAGMRGWSITWADPAAMTLEGVATSRLFHFRDDFVIQVRPADGGGSLVEMRSKSRDGTGDFGVNYRRITTFFKRLHTHAATATARAS